MVAVIKSPRRPRARSSRFPLDHLGAAALVWCGAFLILAFILGYLLH